MIDPIALTAKIPNEKLKLTALAKILDVAIPFNFGLGLQIAKLKPEEVVLKSPDRRKRRNHVGGAHACFLALFGEYPAGLLIAQHFSFEKYRIIISDLKVEYFKQGHGTLKSTVHAPSVWPEFENGELYVSMQSEITNSNATPELVARVQTKWQIKEWSKVRKKGVKNQQINKKN